MSQYPTLRAFDVGNSLESRITILRKLLWDTRNGIRSPQMIYIARQVTRACPARDAMCELRAIYQFTVENVRYAGDVVGVDTFLAPLRTLQMGSEDCDGHALVNCALAAINGFKVKVRITSNRGTTWDHIYCMAGLPKNQDARWVALDTTLAHGRTDFSRFGHEPPRAKFKDFLMDMP